METFVKKITSRKFLLTLVGLISCLALAAGAEAEEVEGAVSIAAAAVKQVAAVLGALGCIAAYNEAESKIDAAAASAAVTQVAVPVIQRQIVEGIAVEDLTDDQLRSLLQQCGFTYTETMTREEMLAALDEATETDTGTTA